MHVDRYRVGLLARHETTDAAKRRSAIFAAHLAQSLSMTAFKLTGWRILVVDDDADSLDMFAELLRHEGGSVDKTHSSTRALQLLKTRTYDLLISDVHMPGIDGYQIIEATRRLPSNRGILAIAMTGYGDVSDREQARNSGFDIHLFKPASVGHIKAAVARHLIEQATERG